MVRAHYTTYRKAFTIQKIRNMDAVFVNSKLNHYHPFTIHFPSLVARSHLVEECFNFRFARKFGLKKYLSPTVFRSTTI